ncbi:Aste57867_11392 [Aphanomyces stellatus]|uniref:Aste57867_11392 protein n=1 Tax=Aphanomyces stellatus TaxID=120398 RepID=A0A485KSU9_9STRA|nr:hypothetical protein As57867_011350 [Aphanomyces stellatus]VFT88253.1 Aste57867_11392 [Aphanomyces stellatus]
MSPTGGRQQSSNNFMSTPAAFPPPAQQFPPKPQQHQNIMNQFQTSSSTIQTPANGPARTQYMTSSQPQPMATNPYSPFATGGGAPAMVNNPFADAGGPAPAYPFASAMSTAPSGGTAPRLSIATTNNPFGDPFATNTPPPPAAAYQTYQAPQATFRSQSSTVQDFDPFSPMGSTPRMPFDFPVDSPPPSPRHAAPLQKPVTRATQEDSRRHVDPHAFATSPAKRHSVKDILEIEAMSVVKPKKATNPMDDNGFSSSTDAADAFADNAFANLDDDFNPRASGLSASPSSRRGTIESNGSDRSLARGPSIELPDELDEDEYEVMFDYGSKLGVLMERVDTYVKESKQDRKRELAVVKLVVEGGAADRIGVKVGSIIRGINHKDMEYESYNTVLELIKTASRPMTIRLKERSDAKEATQGAVLTRISSGTFSVGNLTAGNAKWDSKYFAFGGAKMDVLQLFVSRAAYHECVIALYEKRQVSTQIQSFRLYRDHKLSPIKSKIYKGYGNLHYFSLTVPSLRFVAAKFASENYDTIKNMWQLAFEAIEKKKRQAY